MNQRGRLGVSLLLAGLVALTACGGAAPTVTRAPQAAAGPTAGATTGAGGQAPPSPTRAVAPTAALPATAAIGATRGTAAPAAATATRAAATTTRTGAAPVGTPVTHTPATATGAGAGGQEYADPRGRFSLRLPPGWQQQEVPGGLTAFAPADRSAALIVASAPTPTTDLDSYNQQFEDNLRQRDGYLPISLDPVVVDGRPGYRRVATIPSGGLVAQTQYVYFLDGDTVHALTFTTAPEAFARYAPTFDAIASPYRVGR